MNNFVISFRFHKQGNHLMVIVEDVSGETAKIVFCKGHAHKELGNFLCKNGVNL